MTEQQNTAEGLVEAQRQIVEDYLLRSPDIKYSTSPDRDVLRSKIK